MTSNTFRYQPTRERVEILRIANEGQLRPEDPGHGERLYAVRFPDGRTGQASVGELLTEPPGMEPRRGFRRDDWQPANYYTRELDHVRVPESEAPHYRLKVTNGLGAETKWLTVTPEVLATIRGALATLTDN